MHLFLWSFFLLSSFQCIKRTSFIAYNDLRFTSFQFSFFFFVVHRPQHVHCIVESIETCFFLFSFLSFMFTYQIEKYTKHKKEKKKIKRRARKRGKTSCHLFSMCSLSVCVCMCELDTVFYSIFFKMLCPCILSM